jgi:hypothetical protein
MIRPLVATLALLGLAMASPAGAEDDGASATIEYRRGFADGRPFLGADQEYRVLESDGMSFRRAALFNFLSRSGPRTREAPAGQRLTINAIISYGDVGVGQCTGRARFTPIAGHAYTVIQVEVRPGVCEFHIVDTTTGAAPLDLEVVNDISGRAQG